MNTGSDEELYITIQALGPVAVTYCLCGKWTPHIVKALVGFGCLAKMEHASVEMQKEKKEEWTLLMYPPGTREGSAPWFGLGFSCSVSKFLWVFKMYITQ